MLRSLLDAAQVFLHRAAILPDSGWRRTLMWTVALSQPPYGLKGQGRDRGSHCSPAELTVKV